MFKSAGLISVYEKPLCFEKNIKINLPIPSITTNSLLKPTLEIICNLEIIIKFILF